MRHSILRAGIVATFVALAATAQAAPHANAIGREPEAKRVVIPSQPGNGPAPAWMTQALLGAFSRSTGTTQPASVPVEAPAMRDAERILSAKPHQNPAFPAAFVFQSNSALFLAAADDAHAKRSAPAGG